MGSPLYEIGRDNEVDDEIAHPVSLTDGFWIGEHEVTRTQFSRFIDSTGYKTDAEKGEGYDGTEVTKVSKGVFSKEEDANWRTLFPGDGNFPVVGITRKDAESFCRWLTKIERDAYRLPSDYTYQLPTEAQWEYACRAGTSTPFSFGNDRSLLPSHANFADINVSVDFAETEYNDGIGAAPARVGSYKPNTWGLFDMHGNVAEWCAGSFRRYSPGKRQNPIPHESGSGLIWRGGGWIHSSKRIRSAYRGFEKEQSGRNDYIGFRIVLSKKMNPIESEDSAAKGVLKGQIFVLTNGEEAIPCQGANLRTYPHNLSKQLIQLQPQVERLLFSMPSLSDHDWDFFREAFLELCFLALEKQNAAHSSNSDADGNYEIGQPEGSSFLLSAHHHRELDNSGMERCYWLEEVNPTTLPPNGLLLSNGNILNHGGTSKGPLDLAGLEQRFEKWKPGARAQWERIQAAEEASRKAKLLEGKAPFTIPNLGLEMLLVAPGNFLMGSPENEVDRSSDERQHRVRISQPFWLGKYEVTQGQWKDVMGDNPSRFSGNDLPVEQVSWEDAMGFCAKLNKQESSLGRLPAGYTYSLPTEAQWEYACRAGTTTATAFGDSLSSRDANFDGDDPYGGASKGPDLNRTTAVGSYLPNAWGFYDMHGNVHEWCHDWYEDYPGGSVTDPVGPSSGTSRVLRGGGWLDFGRNCRSADRLGYGPGVRGSFLGFRLSLRSE